MKTLSCPNKACLLASARSIICYGFYNTNSGKRRRYRDHQGEGIGRTLLEHLEALVPSTLFNEIFVYSTLSGETFYRHCGYQCRGEHVLYVDDQPLPTRFMVKTLGEP